MKIARASTAHVPGLARLMRASPLLKRYGVTLGRARSSLLEGLRARDQIVVALEAEIGRAHV